MSQSYLAISIRDSERCNSLTLFSSHHPGASFSTARGYMDSRRRDQPELLVEVRKRVGRAGLWTARTEGTELCVQFAERARMSASLRAFHLHRQGVAYHFSLCRLRNCKCIA
jgi:hypothetical protein